MSRIIVQFSEHKIAMFREIKYHPKLAELLVKYDMETQMGEILAIVYAYCGIGINEVYSTEEELDKVYTELFFELKNKRAPIISINPPDSGIIH